MIYSVYTKIRSVSREAIACLYGKNGINIIIQANDFVLVCNKILVVEFYECLSIWKNRIRVRCIFCTRRIRLLQRISAKSCYLCND